MYPHDELKISKTFLQNFYISAKPSILYAGFYFNIKFVTFLIKKKN